MCGGGGESSQEDLKIKQMPTFPIIFIMENRVTFTCLKLATQLDVGRVFALHILCQPCLTRGDPENKPVDVCSHDDDDEDNYDDDL